MQIRYLFVLKYIVCKFSNLVISWCIFWHIDHNKVEIAPLKIAIA